MLSTYVRESYALPITLMQSYVNQHVLHPFALTWFNRLAQMLIEKGGQQQQQAVP